MDCTIINGFEIDGRYSNISDYSINEYDLQFDSGVIDIIQDSTGSKGDLRKRKYVELDFWTRPTIPFKLECETPNT